MSNEHHIKLDGLKIEEPMYYLAYIIDYKKTSGDGRQVSRTSANGQFNPDIFYHDNFSGHHRALRDFLEYPFLFPNKNGQCLAFLKFQGREYRYHQGRFEITYTLPDGVSLEPHSTPNNYPNTMGRSPFWDFKLYCYFPVSDLTTRVEGQGIAVYDENGRLTYIKGDTDIVYAEDLKFGDAGGGRLYHSHPYELAGHIKKFYASSAAGELVRAEAHNQNVAATYYKLNTPILSIKAPTDADENLLKSQGRYIIYR